MNPSQNPSALRSKKIITETLLLLMKQYPYGEITIKHILLESGISRKTFYRNFTSKDDVLNAYIDTMLISYTKALANQNQYLFIPMLDIIFSVCEKNKELLFLLRDNQLLHLFLFKLNKFILEEHGKLTGHDLESRHNRDNDLFSDYIIFFNIGGIWNVIVKWIDNDMLDSVNDIKKTLAYYLSDIGNIDLRNI